MIKMYAGKLISILFFFPGLFTGVKGVICLFHHLKSDCQYRLDGFAMSRIRATINECNDPVDITFKITCENPKLDWSRTFHGSMDTEEIPGYFQRVFLQVQQQYSSQSKKYGIQVTILSEHLRNVEIMNSTLLLFGSNCSLLNKKSKIAISVLGSLAGIAVIALIVLCIIKRRRERALAYQSTPPLVQNAEMPEHTFPAHSASVPREATNHDRPNDFQDMVTYSGLSHIDHQRF